MENRNAEIRLLTQERMASRRRPSKRLYCHCFDLTNRFSKWLRLVPCESVLSNTRDNLGGVADGLEEILKRPAAGQVNANATRCFADAHTDLEQLNAQGFDLCWAHRRR